MTREGGAHAEPRCFVFKRGVVDSATRRLLDDLRRMMSPNTSRRLRETRSNRLRDFVSAASIFGVTHMMYLSQDQGGGVKLRVARLPHGPTLTFNVENYTLMTDVRAGLRKPRNSESDYLVPPLIVMNGLKFNNKDDPNPKKRNRQSSSSSSGKKHDEMTVKILSSMIINLFPSIDVNEAKLSACRRVVLFDREPETGHLEVRHFAVQRRPCGTTQGVSKILKMRGHPEKLPNLGRTSTIADAIMSHGDGWASESEIDDVEEVQVESEDDTPIDRRIHQGPTERRKTLEATRKMSMADIVGGATKKVAVSLVELGPRLKLNLLKVEEEVSEGKVLYHRFVEKSPKELADLDHHALHLKKRRRKAESEHRKILADAEAQVLQKRNKRVKATEGRKKSRKVKKREARIAKTAREEDLKNRTKRRPPPSRRFAENKQGEPILARLQKKEKRKEAKKAGAGGGVRGRVLDRYRSSASGAKGE